MIPLPFYTSYVHFYSSVLFYKEDSVPCHLSNFATQVDPHLKHQVPLSHCSQFYSPYSTMQQTVPGIICQQQELYFVLNCKVQLYLIYIYISAIIIKFIKLLLSFGNMYPFLRQIG